MPIILSNENTLLKFNCTLNCYKLLLENHSGIRICKIASNIHTKIELECIHAYLLHFDRMIACSPLADLLMGLLYCLFVHYILSYKYFHKILQVINS